MSCQQNNKIKKEFRKWTKEADSGTSRLTKRLAYILRYGAVKEGLQVHEGGFVNLKELLDTRVMKWNNEDEVIQEIDTSMSKRGASRFERKDHNGQTMVRARFARRFERNPFHEGSKVCTLLETCIQHVCDNVELYDLQDFPDEFLINSMIHRLKRQKKLNNSTLRTLLSPCLAHLDLEGVYLTEGTLKTIWRICPNLKVLSLKDSGYLLNDHLVDQTARKLPQLESLSLAGCYHLTDKSVMALQKHCQYLQQLNISMIHSISEKSVLDLIQNAAKLEYLDIFDYRISKQGREKIVELAKDRGMTVVLKWLKDADVAPEHPCIMLPNFGKVWYQ